MNERILPWIFIAALAPSLPAQTGGTLEGTVVSRATGAGIPGVSVTLYTRQAVRYTAITDATGGFRVTDMSPGTYEGRYEKPRFADGRSAAAALNSKLHVEMTPQVKLSGRVTDSAGKPAPNVAVDWFRDGAGSQAFVTGDDGSFMFDNLEPGSYTLRARPRAIPKPSSADGTSVATTYYPSVTSLAEARPILVRGDDLSGYEIRLQTVPVHAIRGVVLDENGKPVTEGYAWLLPVIQQSERIGGSSSDHFELWPAGQATGPEEFRMATREDGTFEFPAVPSGDWRVVGQGRRIPMSKDAPFIDISPTGSELVLLGRQDVEGIQVRVAPYLSITGVADFGDVPNHPAGGFSAPPADGQSSLPPVGPPAQRDGTIRLSNVSPGLHRIVPVYVNGYSTAVFLGGLDVTGQMVTLAPGSPSIRVVYKAAAGKVTGTSDKCDGVTVMLVPQQADGKTPGRMTQCQAGGTFEISGVAPGDYYAAAFEGLGPTYPRDPALLTRVRSIGARVKVEQSAATPLELKATRWPQ